MPGAGAFFVLLRALLSWKPALLRWLLSAVWVRAVSLPSVALPPVPVVVAMPAAADWALARY